MEKEFNVTGTCIPEMHFLGYDFNNKEKVRITTDSGIEHVDLAVVGKIKIGRGVLENVEVLWS